MMGNVGLGSVQLHFFSFLLLWTIASLHKKSSYFPSCSILEDSEQGVCSLMYTELWIEKEAVLRPNLEFPPGRANLSSRGI